MNTTRAINRRLFLQRTSIGLPLVAAAPFALRAQPAASANDRIGIGIIGSGDRASALMREMLGVSGKRNVEIVAICDVWKKNREAGVRLVTQTGAREPKQFTRFSELLALREVDAVVIATPDFSHAPILLAALDANKDVYIEKPMTIDIASANRALDLARKNKRIVQAGTQRRSEGQFLGAAKFIGTGALGKISRISGAMHVNQARWARRFDDCRAEDVDWDAFCVGKLKRPFDARLLRCWQLFRDTSNGIPGLWMTHYADAVHLLTGAKYPSSVVSLGDNFVWQDGREHADTFQTLLKYPEGFLFDWGMSLGNSVGVHFTLHGTKGTLDAEKWTFTTEGAADVKASEAQTMKIQPEPSTGHMDNWLQCLRSRARPNADIEFGHQHAVATIMAAIAAETGRRQTWDPAKREVVAS